MIGIVGPALSDKQAGRAVRHGERAAADDLVIKREIGSRINAGADEKRVALQCAAAIDIERNSGTD